jgi:hypothetical protein
MGSAVYDLTFSDQLTYYGTLDDVVDRYPWPLTIDLECARRQLITSAMYRKTALINDGYIVVNRHLVGDLEDLNRSLLGAMLSSGSARLFTRSRGSNIARGLEKTAKNIQSHQYLVNSPQWESIADNLAALERDTGHRNICWPADKNMGELFHLLLQDTAHKVDRDLVRIVPEASWEDFQGVFREYERNISSTFEGARSVWEAACWVHFAGCDVDPWQLMGPDDAASKERNFPGYARVRPMMNVANEIYHLAYSIGAHVSVKSDTREDVRSLRVGAATAYFDESYGFAPVDDVHDELDNYIRDHVDGLLISIPRSLTFSGDFSFIRDFTLNAETRHIGDAYLAALAEFLATGQGRSEVLRLRPEYANKLAKAMLPGVRSGPATATVDALAGTLLGVPFDGISFLLNWLVGLGADQMGAPIIERIRRARISARVQERAEFSRRFPNRGQMAREIGFFAGLLKVDSMEAYAARAKPPPSASAG